MEANRRRSLKRYCKIPRLRLWMHAVQTAVVTRFGSNGYESARTSSSLRNDVSRFGQSRPELRRDFFCWRADDGNFRAACTRVVGHAPTGAETRGWLFAGRIAAALDGMVALADDERLRVLEFTHRRATERRLSTLRNRLQRNVLPGGHPHLDETR